jgi:hypothetical protein
MAKIDVKQIITAHTIRVDWRDANALHDKLDALELVVRGWDTTPDPAALLAGLAELHALLPARFELSRLKPAPGRELCPICHKHLRGGHERDSSDWCDGHEPEDDDEVQ